MSTFLSKHLRSVWVLMGIILISQLSATGDMAFSQDKKIILATDPWPPYYGPDLENQGYFTEISKSAFQRVGYQCDVVFVPWKRALEMAKLGKYDGVLGAFYNDERTQWFTYSAPISETYIVFFTAKGKNIRYDSLKSLEPYKIGVINGYNYSEEFDTAAYLKKEVVHTVSQNIQKLMVGRIDLFIDSKEVTLWTLRKEFPEYVDKIEIVEPAFKVNKLYIPISKEVTDHQQIVRDLNTGLEKIKADGTFDTILMHHGFQ